jgi:hypothetical protein
MKAKIIVVVAIAAAVAAGSAAWKWHSPVRKANESYKVAGWSWGDHANPRGGGGNGGPKG